jgi:hypothetical protein
VTPQGTILDTFVVVTQQGDQFDPVLARGSGGKMLLAYGGWTGIVEDKPYNSSRIWGTLSPHAGTNDRPTDVARVPRPAPTIVRNVLFLPAASDSKAPGWLLDAAGRKVTELRPGANDVSGLAPGVYFVTQKGPRVRGFEDSRVAKVIVTR